MAVAILTLPKGIDFSEYSPQYKGSGVSGKINFGLERSTDDLSMGLTLKPIKIMHVDSNLNLEGLGTSNSNSIVIPQQGFRFILSVTSDGLLNIKIF